jgi:hypothetical protein
VVAQALRFKQFGWYSQGQPHNSNSSASGTGGDLMFSTPLASNTPTLSQFALTIDGVARTLSPIFAGGTDLNFTFAAPAITAGQKLVLSYTPNGAIKLQDAAGNLVAAFSVPIRNLAG